MNKPSTPKGCRMPQFFKKESRKTNIESKIGNTPSDGKKEVSYFKL